MSIRWQDLDERLAPGTWRALELTATDASTPSLCVHACHPRCVRLSADDTPLLWARIDGGYWGYHLLRTRGPGVSFFQPIRFARIDQIGRDPARAPRAWARVFAQMLEAARATPLHEGQWTLGASNLPDCEAILSPAAVQQIHAQTSHGYLDWDREALYPITLRDPSAPTSGRVNAFRKHARAGSLPPIVLVWVSGLCAHVVLDGHDRLHAAALEGVGAPALYLEHVDEVEATQATKDATAAILARSSIPVPHANALALRVFVPRLEAALSRSRSLSGGLARWEDEVRRELARQGIDDAERLEGLDVAPWPDREKF